MSKPVLVIYEEHLAPVRFRGRKKKVYGEQEGNRIRINPDQTEEERLDTLVHELWHFLEPEATEEQVIERAAVISTVLWKYGYRRVHQ